MPIPSAILKQLESLATDSSKMPATMLFNEGWMVRLVMDAAHQGLLTKRFPIGINWFSEAQLRTPFRRGLGPKHESNTRADGILCDAFNIAQSRCGFNLENDATTFTVLEAKINAPLGKGTKNAPGYDQAARTVACMAETLCRANKRPTDLHRLGFAVVATKQSISLGLFSDLMSTSSIRNRVEERIQQFNGIERDKLNKWKDDWFEPTLQQLERTGELVCISWEELLQEILENDKDFGAQASDFYQNCLQVNRSIANVAEDSVAPTKGYEYWLRTEGRELKRVRVLSVGSKNSRVCVENSNEDSLRVPNSNLILVPLEEQTPAPPLPRLHARYFYTTNEGLRRTVEVIRVGDVNSRVQILDELCESVLVPNHQLVPTT